MFDDYASGLSQEASTEATIRAVCRYNHPQHRTVQRVHPAAAVRGVAGADLKVRFYVST